WVRRTEKRLRGRRIWQIHVGQCPNPQTHVFGPVKTGRECLFCLCWADGVKCATQWFQILTTLFAPRSLLFQWSQRKQDTNELRARQQQERGEGESRVRTGTRRHGDRLTVGYLTPF